MAGYVSDESTRTLYAPDACAARALCDAFAGAGYLADMRPEGGGYVVIYVAYTVSRTTVVFPQRHGVR